MRPWQLRAASLDDLALPWLGEPSHAYSPRSFTRARGLTELDEGRTLERQRDSGMVHVHRIEGARHELEVVLTPLGQSEWIRARSESCRPGVRALRVHLSVPMLRTQQVVRIMSRVGLVDAKLDAVGAFTVVRVVP